jgi:ribosomal protein L28
LAKNWLLGYIRAFFHKLVGSPWPGRDRPELGHLRIVGAVRFGGKQNQKKESASHSDNTTLIVFRKNVFFCQILTRVKQNGKFLNVSKNTILSVKKTSNAFIVAEESRQRSSDL